MANDYAVGDEFEGSPTELNRWISPVWAIGGRVEFYGRKATIVYLPPVKDDSPPVEEYFEVFSKQLDDTLEVANATIEEESVVPVVIHATKEELEEIKLVKAPVEEKPVVKTFVKEAAKDPVIKTSSNPTVTRGRPKKTIDPLESEVK